MPVAVCRAYPSSRAARPRLHAFRSGFSWAVATCLICAASPSTAQGVTIRAPYIPGWNTTGILRSNPATAGDDAAVPIPIAYADTLTNAYGAKTVDPSNANVQAYQALAPTSSDPNPVYAATAATNEWAFITYTATQQGLSDQQVLALTFDLQLGCSFNDTALNTVWSPPGGLQTTATGQNLPLYNPLNADGPYGQAGPYLALFFPVVHYLAPAGPIGSSLTPTAFFPWLGIPQVSRLWLRVVSRR